MPDCRIPLLGEGPVWVEARYFQQSDSPIHHRRWRQADLDISILHHQLESARGWRFRRHQQRWFRFLDFENLSADPIQLPEADVPGNRFNDGKVDNSGRYWAGTMDLDQQAESGALYRLDPDLSVAKVDEDYIICNGPTFNLENSIIYHTDSIKRVIYALDIGAGGELSNKRVFTRFTEDGDGVPDGMTVDSEDCLWVAHFGGARLSRFSPGGELLETVPLPAPNITSCTFAGAELDTLYITCARIFMSDAELEQYPLAGSLLAFKPGVTGAPTPLFGG